LLVKLPDKIILSFLDIFIYEGVTCGSSVQSSKTKIIKILSEQAQKVNLLHPYPQLSAVYSILSLKVVSISPSAI